MGVWRSSSPGMRSAKNACRTERATSRPRSLSNRARRWPLRYLPPPPEADSLEEWQQDALRQ
eukprot:3555879-Alexandrium_andersonii.AAC.1